MMPVDLVLDRLEGVKAEGRELPGPVPGPRRPRAEPVNIGGRGRAGAPQVLRRVRNRGYCRRARTWR